MNNTWVYSYPNVKMLWNVCCSHYVHNLYRWHEFVCYKYLFFKVSVKMLYKLEVLTTLKSIVFYSVSWIEIVAFEILTNLTSIRCDVWTSKFDVPLYSDFYGLVFKYTTSFRISTRAYVKQAQNIVTIKSNMSIYVQLWFIS